MFVLPFNALPLCLLLLLLFPLLLLLLLVCAPSSLHGPCTQGYASSYAKYVGATRWPAMWEAEWISLCMPVCEYVCVCVMEWGWMARCVLHVSTLLACRSSCLHHVLNNGYVSWHIECPAVSDITRVLATVRHMLANVFGIVNVITPESLCPPLPCARCLEVARLIESPRRVEASDSISSKCAETLKPNSHQIERSKWAGSG